MNFDDLKQLVSSNKERLVFIENDKPSFVLLSFEDYRSLVNQQISKGGLPSLTPPAMPPVSIQLPQQTESSNSVKDPTIEQSGAPTAPFVPKELKLEDLPF